MSSHEPRGGGDGLRLPGRRRDIVILCSVVVLLMSAVSVANLSVPVLAASPLDPSTTEQTWFVDAFVIAFACLLLPAEMFGSRFGEERVLVFGLVLFGVAAAVALLASDMTLLIGSRALAGVGAGLALPQTLSILLHRTQRRQHAGIVAAWTASTSVAGVVGNGLGGPLIAAGGWRSVFVVTLPAALVVIALVVAVVRMNRAPDATVRIDLPGTALFIVAAVAGLVTLIEAPMLLGTPILLAIPFVICVVAAFGFWRVERRTRMPLLHLELFRAPAVRAASLGIAVTFAGLFTLFSLNAHLVQTVRGEGAGIAGIALIPVSVAMFVVTYASVPLVRRVGLSPVVGSGLVISAAGYLLASRVIEGSFLAYELALVVIGVGAGLCSSPLSTRLTMAYAQTGGRAGAGANSTLRELSSAVGVATVGVALTTAGAAGRSAEAEAIVAAASGLFVAVAAVLLAAGVGMAVDIRLARRRG